MESFLLINKREYTTLQNKKKRYKKALKREQTNQAKVNEALEKVRKESDAARDEITQLKARHEALEAARRNAVTQAAAAQQAKAAAAVAQQEMNARLTKEQLKEKE